MSKTKTKKVSKVKLEQEPYDPSQFNLNSDMKLPPPPITEEGEPDPVIPPVFQLPFEVMKQTSDLNDKLQDGPYKLIGRQLSGKVRSLHNLIVLANTTYSEAALKPPVNLKMPVEKYIELTVRRTGSRFITNLHEATAGFDRSLLHVEQVSKIQLPPLWGVTLQTLAKIGLFHIHKPPKGKELDKALWGLPDGLINALGIRPHLASPYSKTDLDRIKYLEIALKILEPLHSFGAELSIWEWVE